MSETKFTPGPWRYKEEDVDLYDGSYNEPMVVTDADDSGITKQIAVIRVGLEGTYANGRLIAAAPDLYGKLVKIGGWLTRLAEKAEMSAETEKRFLSLRDAWIADGKNYRATIKDIESILAKADGRT